MSRVGQSIINIPNGVEVKKVVYCVCNVRLLLKQIINLSIKVQYTSTKSMCYYIAFEHSRGGRRVPGRFVK